MRALGALAACLLATTALHAEEPRFDPLTPAELERVVALLIESGRTDADTRIARVTRVPAEKGAAVVRRARVVAVLGGQATEILADLDGGRLESAAISEGRAPITSNDWARANAVLRQSSEWRAALAARGIDDPERVFCESLSAGHFPGTPSAEGRVIRLPCYEITAATTNIYGRPVEGLVATVDLDRRVVVDLLDEGVQPLPEPARQLPVASGVETEADPRIGFDGNRISFGPWSVHAGMDDQVGLVVSDVRFRAGGEARQILHEGHVSEIFVPYMDPEPSWAFRTYLDAGEFGLGTLTSPLVPGIDCPAGAAFLGSHRLSPTARVVHEPRAICVFLEPLRGPVWRHYEALNGLSAGAAGEALVVRAIASIAHYDYVIDWVFGPSGEIEIRIGATGIDAVKALAGTENVPEGNRVTRDLVAVFHDHFFSLRLDLDIDGRRNTLVRETVVADHGRRNALKRSFWTLRAEEIAAEGALNAPGPGTWRVRSDERRGPFGEATGYQVVTEGTVSVLHPEDAPQRRGAFSAAPLWLTRLRPGERAAAGDAPNQHPGGAGLPAYADGEATVAEDLVLWPTVGFRHVTRAEDWPALSVVWKSVRLRPYGFFPGNPAFAE